ncbi:MAG: universal stress protein [Chloroflexi bacterium]|jgi:nucleotide-binding universal stress UspA family protein|nr:universal stress protein [Chloroflexota bacterium]MBT7081725.1 universal stress protein [Chloroflexota bacterium]MBT7290754.1 universal stress protein [Chloroflexota bacterium]
MVRELSAPQKILVLVNGTPIDNDVVKIACKMTSKTLGDIIAIYVIELKRTLPLEAEVEPEIQKGEDVLDHVERLAGEQGRNIETALLQARDKGPAIVEEAIEREADLIILGVNYEKPYGEFSLGSTLPYVLKHAHSSVVIYREPIPVQEDS